MSRKRKVKVRFASQALRAEMLARSDELMDATLALVKARSALYTRILTGKARRPKDGA